MLVASVVVTLLGIGLLFYITVQQVDDRVQDVSTKIDRSVNQLRTDVRRELDARVPATGLGGSLPVTPTPDPLLTPTETPTPDPLEITPTPTPTVEGESTPDASATPTPSEEPEIINP
jgi:hypothetical protein